MVKHTASLQSFPSSGEEATFSITWRALLRYPGCHSRGMLWYTARSPCCTSTFPVAKRNNEEAQPWLPTMPETEALKAQVSTLHLAAGGTGKDHFKSVWRASFQPLTLQMDEEMVKFIVYIFKYKIAKTCFSSFLFGLMEIMRMYESQGWGKLREVDISVSKWSYPYKTSQTTETLFLFQEQISEKEIPQLSYGENLVNIWQCSLPGNVWHFLKCSKTPYRLSLWEKRIFYFALLSFIWASALKIIKSSGDLV